MDSIAATIPDSILSPKTIHVSDDEKTEIDGVLTPPLTVTPGAPDKLKKKARKRKTAPATGNTKAKKTKGGAAKKTKGSLAPPPLSRQSGAPVMGEAELREILHDSKAADDLAKELDPRRKIFRYRTGYTVDEEITKGWPKSHEHLDAFEFARGSESPYCIYHNLWKPVLIEFPDYVKTFGYHDPNRASKFGDSQNKIDFRLGQDWVETEEINAMYETAMKHFEAHLNNSRINPGKIKFAPIIREPKVPMSADGVRFNSIMSAMVTRKTTLFNEPNLTEPVHSVTFGHRIRPLLVFGGFKFVHATKQYHPILNLSLGHVSQKDLEADKENISPNVDAFLKATEPKKVRFVKTEDIAAE